MCDDDAGGAVGDGVGEDFAGMDETAGESANGNDALGDEPICAIEREADEIFLLFVANVGELLNGLLRTINNWSVRLQ